MSRVCSRVDYNDDCCWSLDSVFQHVDALFREYLLFRGFHETLEMFKRQKQKDKARGFQVSLVPSRVISLAGALFFPPSPSSSE